MFLFSVIYLTVGATLVATFGMLCLLSDYREPLPYGLDQPPFMWLKILLAIAFAILIAPAMGISFILSVFHFHFRRGVRWEKCMESIESTKFMTDILNS